MRTIFTTVVLGLMSTTIMAAQLSDDDIAALYAKPSPFEKVGREQWIAESENAFVIRDKYPQAPVHLLIIPKKRVPTLFQASESLLGEMLALARRAAEQEGVSRDGFRLVINTHPQGGQSVYHLHFHLIGGRQLKWLPG